MLRYRQQIKEARLANDITIAEMERRTGIPRAQYRAFEEGAHVRTARLEAIVKAIPNLLPCT
jgi:transcriptional regulator with XRE-family HTH domain